MRRLLWVLCAVAACSSKDGQPAVGSSPADEQIAAPTRALPADDAEPIDVASAIDAWRAVIERDQLLARRGDEGTVIGVVARTGDGQTWLLDRRERAAGLGIALGGADGLDAGQVVAVRGSWRAEPDSMAGWVWQAHSWQVVGPAGNAETLPAPPLPATAITDGERPEAGRTFYVVAEPVNPGDGWTITERPDWAAHAILLLPGDEPIYGGLDYRSAGERWNLESGVRYAAPIEEVREATDKRPLAIWRALGAPVRIGEDDPAESAQP